MYKINMIRILTWLLGLIFFMFILFFIPTACNIDSDQDGFTSNYPVIIYGDSRTGHNIHQRIVDLIVSLNPSIVFHTGDLVADGLNSSDWSIFNKIVINIVNNSEFYPSLGNHENNSPLYFDNFNLPNNERWYYVEKDHIRFIVLDSNWDCSRDSEQYIWLIRSLQNISTDIKFIIVLFHHPPFSTGPHDEDEKDYRKHIVPVFEQYGVGIVFNGHDHSYERSYYNGIYYIVTGGGGAPLYSKSRESDYSQLFIKVHHFCKLYLNSGKLYVEVYDIDNSMVDVFSLK